MSDELAKPAADLQSFGGSPRRMATSLDLSVRENRKLLLGALQNCDGRLTEQVNVAIRTTNYVCQDVELTSKETGEVIHATRLVLIDADGLTYECVSQTLLQSLQAVAFTYGPPPWEPPLTLTVRSKRRGERAIYWFDAE